MASKNKKGAKQDVIPKTYKSETSGNVTKAVEQAEEHLKVSIPKKLESEILTLIQEHNDQTKSYGELSKRLTSRKLGDVYNSLSDAGFTQKQIENTMNNTIMKGGDLITALDWLCLNISNDQLPAGFSETLLREEEKKRRQQFDQSLQVQKSHIDDSSETKQPSKSQKKKKKKKSGGGENKGGNMKNWILQYANMSSSESEGEDGAKEFDPNSKYLSLSEKLEDVKEQASLAKQQGKESIHKKLSKAIREMTVEINALETFPGFDPSIKAIPAPKEEKKMASKPAETSKAESLPSTSSSPSVPITSTSSSPSTSARVEKPKKAENDMDFVCFDALEEHAVKSPVQAKTGKSKAPEDVRKFEYTRQQWTGKSPKQFLIDWVRKHLPKSDAPKYSKIQLKMNRFKSKVRVDRKNNGGMLELTPDILCENVKEAEQLASTLALYHLCKGQSVHQLLPPPFRDVWLEWLDADKTKKQNAIDKENKPRDQYIAKLMKKLKIENKNTGENNEGKENGEERELTWEDLADEDIEVKPEPKKTKGKGKKVKLKLKSDQILDILSNNQTTDIYRELYKTRENLPVYQYKQNILDKLFQNNVVVIAGETGSGKSTQVPQFILEDMIRRDEGEKCNIICTQPRRISAISLATRVSQELGEYNLGSKDSLCGYQIRFESKKNMNTKLLYCTTGVILRQLQNQPHLNDVSHLIIDEVHERSVQSDFLLIVVKKLLLIRRDLKIVLMSATLDSEKFSSYFQHCPVINIPGRTFPVQVFHVEDVIEKCGYIVDDDSKYSYNPNQLVQIESASLEVTVKGGESTKMGVNWTKENISKIDHTDLPGDVYSLRTRNAVTRLNHTRINMDLIMDLIKYLEHTEPYDNMEGAILIFLPGLSDIQELNEMLTTDREFSDPRRYQILALHSVLSSGDQTRAFNIPPQGVRKVVLATNIAETGITIPDVIFVIDTGKVKETRYIETKQMSCLEEVFISKANAKQRQGRAGRVQSGYCFRLFTKAMFDDFKAYTIPEILRVPLEELCLNIMKCNFGNPIEFLREGLDPPQELSVIRAMNLLRDVGACEEEENKLTPLGQHLASLPVHVRIGKMLLYSAVFGCLEQVAVIAAAMTDKSPFVVPLGKRAGADQAKQNLSMAVSDHFTLYNAYLGWKRASYTGRNSEETYCRQNFLKRSTLLDIENVKEDLMKLVGSIGFDTSYSLSKTTEKTDPAVIAMVKAIITAGLYPNVGKVTHTPLPDAALYPDRKLCIVETQHAPIAIHPSSVNRYMENNGWVIYHEKVKLARVYLRDVTLISPYPLLLFGGAIDVQHTQQLVTIDSWITFKTYARTGVIFKELRNLLSDLLLKKLESPSLNFSDNELVCMIQKLLQSERVTAAV